MVSDCRYSMGVFVVKITMFAFVISLLEIRLPKDLPGDTIVLEPVEKKT